MSPVLPDKVLRLMDPKDRVALGKAGVTAAEAGAKHEARLERELQSQIAQYLRLLGVWFDQDAMHKRRTGTRGTPDFLFAYRPIGAVDARPIAIEAKGPTGKVNEAQRDCHCDMVRNGWYVLIARSLADVQGLLRRLDTGEAP